MKLVRRWHLSKLIQAGVAISTAALAYRLVAGGCWGVFAVSALGLVMVLSGIYVERKARALWRAKYLYGAHTGRSSSRGLQLQNVKRGKGSYLGVSSAAGSIAENPWSTIGDTTPKKHSLVCPVILNPRPQEKE